MTDLVSEQILVVSALNEEDCDVRLQMLDMKIFVDTDADVRLARRLKRDICQRGRDLEGVLKQYCNLVKPAFYHYIAPSMVHADIIVPRGGENEVAIELIVHHVHTQLQLVSLRATQHLGNLQTCSVRACN